MLIFLVSFMTLCGVLTIYAVGKTLLVRKELLTALSEPLALGEDDPEMFLENSQQGHRLTQEQVAEIENRLRHLKMAVVVAHSIERPKDLLRDAVESNLSRGVSYRFLVSPSVLEAGPPVYFNDFRTSAQFIRDKEGLDCTLEEMVDIQPLAFEWDDAPYIFYRQWQDKADGDSGEIRMPTIAFRGESKRRGLANTYFSVPPQFAHTLVRSLLAPAAEDMKASVDGFESDEFGEARGRLLEFGAHAD